ncbi:xylulokinase [Vibrio sp. ZSDZ65]|uniref:Xylulose kinase n=1 Tax=Vibrio qingdaonensis TaxID=2829491 RepID=A0A9X3HW25_9VIBR|nr:xylulokinase [Vibrio qingdaonensis]MCW8345818.1 xylulokinase [Vibrio qingdaonensis]
MYLGIDCGTQGTKAIIWNNGEILSSAYTPHQISIDNQGKREQSPQWWFDAMVSSINKALIDFEGNRKSIKGIGVSGQQHGLVLLDSNDRILCDSLLWCDTRPELALKDFERKYNIAFPEKIGIQVPVAFTIAKLLWIKDNNPSAFKQIHKIMLPHDYLNYCLTGRYAIEAGDASGTGWFDTHTKSIDQGILGLMDLPSSYQAPEVVTSDAVFGHVRPQMCAVLGLPSNVIVSSGGGDNMMAAIGTGNVDEGMLTISLGTSGTVFGHSHQQIDSTEYPDLNAFCSSSNGYLPLASTMNVTTANNQILDLMGKDISHFDQMLNSANVGSDGLLSLPFYNGARLPNVSSAKGAILGMTASNLSQQNLLRSTVEGVTYNLARGISVLKQSGVIFSQACIIGGGANSRVWRQMISDVTNLKLVVPHSTEAAAVGGAIQAYWACENLRQQRYSLSDICKDFVQFDQPSTVHPNSENHQKYQSLSNDYHTLVDNYMSSDFHR